MRPLRTERAQFLVDNLDLPEAAQMEGARWEHFQLNHLETDDIFRIEVKSRQIAWSFLTAAEAVADGVLTGRGSVFVSINLDEAKEKIRYANNIRLALPKAMRPKLLTDNRLEVEFDNGARLISLPSTAPRGKAQMNVYLDEFAHVRDDAVIYTAALPMITKGDRRLRIGSSPMGASGRFWEIFTESFRQYPGFTRKQTPWWETHSFCLNVKLARQLAPTMSTFERVEMFGSDRIKAIYANMPEEDFQQEYEVVFLDESTAWISWEEIKDVQDASLKCILSNNVKTIDNARQAIDQAAQLVTAGVVELVLGAGYDVGRTRNASELFIVGKATTSSYPLRLAITLDNCDFDNQFDVISYAMMKLPIILMFIDQNGIGRSLAEKAEKAFPSKVQGVDFTNATKSVWAADAKMLVQQHKTPLPVDRDIAYQIHSIKKTITPSKNVVFDTERNEKHHADKFWAWALGLAAAKAGYGPSVPPPVKETHGDSRFVRRELTGSRWRGRR
jgi:phage FluMu gp28-like protein